MADIDFLLDGGGDGCPTVLLAHGAGAPMDTPFMAAIASGLASRGLRVARFEFAYMAARRSGGVKRPPPKVDLLQAEFLSAVSRFACEGPLIIGGKSMGGRVASLVADGLFAEGRICGLLCLGYPFHPSGKPERLRTAHLETLKTPALVCQGSRDPFGTREDVAGYALPPAISLCWLEDGDHDLKPRKTVTGFGQEHNLEAACAAAAGWAKELAQESAGRPGSRGRAPGG
ncbi:alpha/beta family hydrolase [Leisingera sp. ANG-S5]|uniref:alpha/beta family hydrolase n=1 Tax=Leisingera sp. ANG-S5 TaxID=1577901 RepID=UPI00057C5A0F|nr:alpha/beta family hydrolase [Leisingera sp. ANG-S5]KIC31064.1 alpha/beta hydrolase [Leisingera sp. ANG-S5]